MSKIEKKVKLKAKRNGSLEPLEGDEKASFKLVRANSQDDDDAEISVEELDEDDSHTFSNHISLRNIVAFSIVVWLGQVVISVALKKYGIIDQDLNEIVANRIIPKIQQQIESNLPFKFNESWSMQSHFGHIMASNERPGFQMAQKGAKGQYPVLLIPGFVTSGLEVWAGDECARSYFRQRMWGRITGARQILMERECVFKHLTLDMTTGLDPEGIRIRAAQGFEAADYFMANYWVWGKIIENLADVGYDPSNMSMESYDWRLAFPLLEQRDGYFTNLKMKMEANKKISGKKTIVMTHSLGAILIHFFFAWVTTPEEEGGGGGGEKWVDEYIHAYVNIAGAQLGTPKAATAILSGEISDLIITGTMGNLFEQFMGRQMRRDLWASWGSLWTMLLKGGDDLWNYGADVMHASPEQTDGLASYTNDPNVRDLSPLIVMTDDPDSIKQEQLDALACEKESLIDASTEKTVNKALRSFASRKIHSVSETNQFLLDWGVGYGPMLSSSKQHSFDPNEKSSNRTWHDITRTPLPYAPNMKIYCLYGVGLDTGRSYFYKRNYGEGAVDERNSTSQLLAIDPPYILDTSIDDPSNKIVKGVKQSDGDGSVPLLSLGYMCADAWRRESTKLNPSGSKVITREYLNENGFSVDDPMRGGPRSANHVDILGNIGMLEDLIKIVTETDLDQVEEDYIVSDIKNIARRIDEHRNGGLKQP